MTDNVSIKSALSALATAARAVKTMLERYPLSSMEHQSLVLLAERAARGEEGVFVTDNAQFGHQVSSPGGAKSLAPCHQILVDVTDLQVGPVSRWNIGGDTAESGDSFYVSWKEGEE